MIMSIERNIHKDISKYESKLIGPFTTRNIVFGGPGLILGVGSFILLNGYVSEDIRYIIAFALAIPLLLLAIAKPYGIPLEKYIAIVFVSQVLSPKHRKYITENTYKNLFIAEESIKEKDKKKKKKANKPLTGEYQRFI